MITLANEFRHILKGSEVFIKKGKKLTNNISLPDGFAFSDVLLYQIGIGEKPISDAVELAIELKEWKNQ